MREGECIQCMVVYTTDQLTPLIEPRSVLANAENLQTRKARAQLRSRVFFHKTKKSQRTYAAGEKLSVYSAAPWLRSTTVAVTVLPL